MRWRWRRLWRRKTGIFWLAMATWNSAGLGIRLDHGEYARAGFDVAVTLFCVVYAYRRLTKPLPQSVTVTITADTAAFDAAMVRAQQIEARMRRRSGVRP